MAMTRGMIAKQNQNASNRKRSKTIDNDDDSPSWSNPIHDILFSVIMRLGVVDFVAFSGVCKKWRTIALSHRNMFMLSRQPMAIHISTELAKRKECWLEDCDGRKFKTILPCSRGRTCVGLVSGYLILFGMETHDFRLVNPITRHELHFPRFPFPEIAFPQAFRGTLVFSPTTSRLVFVISVRFSRTVSVSLSSKQASWTHLSSDSPISDIIFFKGKIYTLNREVRLCEVRLNPKPTLTPLKMKNMVTSLVILPDFATLGEKLFVRGYHYRSKVPCEYVEVDFDQIKWVIPIALIEHAVWEEPQTQCVRFGYFNCTDKNKNKRVLVATGMSYLPHKCLDVNRLHE